MQKKNFLKKMVLLLFLIGFFFVKNALTASIKGRIAGVVRRAINYFDDGKVKVDKKLDDWKRRRAAIRKGFEFPKDAPLDKSTRQLILTEKGKNWFLYSKEAEDWFENPEVIAWIKEDKELSSLYNQRYTGPVEPYLERVKTFFKNRFSSSEIKRSGKETGLSK